MKKIDLPLLSDVAFYTVCAFLFAVGILRYFRLPTGVVFGAAVPFALAAGTCAFLAVSHSHRRKVLSRKQKKRRDDLLLHLALEQDERVRELLGRAFEAEGNRVEIRKDAIVADGKTYVPLFTMQPCSADAVAALLKRYGTVPFTLVCNALTPEAEKLMRDFGREAQKGDAVFSLLERTQTYPQTLLLADLPRPKLKARLKRTFSKSNARPFFVSGVLLLGMSLFVIFPLYYLIAGSVLLSVSVLVRVFGYRDIGTET